LSASFDKLGNNATVAMHHARRLAQQHRAHVLPFDEPDGAAVSIIEVYPALAKVPKDACCHPPLPRASSAGAGAVAPFGSRLHLCRHGLPHAADGVGDPLQYESAGRLFRQRRDGEPVLDDQDRVADRFTRFDEGQWALFEYLEVFYKQHRRHSTLDYVKPAELERQVTVHATALSISPPPLEGSVPGDTAA
jgi:hypothetical protein